MKRLAQLLVALTLSVTAAGAEPLVIRGATLVDVERGGARGADVENAVIVIAEGHVRAVGPAGSVEVPPTATVLEAGGRFVVPGLIDAFAALNNQSYANAYLYEGVTSIVGVASARRGDLFLGASPGPRVHALESVGRGAGTTAEHLADLEAIHAEGARIALLMYGLTPDQIPPLVSRARELGMGTIGELGLTSYAEGAAAGLDAFVHTTRYSLDLAPEPMRRAVAEQPFSDDLDSPKWRYYFFLTTLAEDDPRVRAHAERLAAGAAALMPTAALLYLDQDWAKNPWREPVAAILDPGDIDSPADPETGRRAHAPEHAEAYAAVARAEIRLERAYRRAGCRYLAGSGTDVWGTMPGLSLHQELELLSRTFGLTPREALAAATANVAEAFRWPDLGRVAPGARADLLVLDSDPRLDVAALRKIETLVLDGRIVDRAALLEPLPGRSSR